jgi:hypothetical protein
MAVVLVAVATLAPVSSAAPGTKKRIERVVQRALSVDCKVPPDIRPATFSDATPGAAIRKALGILRRPQTAGETISPSAVELPIHRIRRSSVRFVESGTRDYVIFGADSIAVRPRKCASPVKRRFAQLVRGSTAAFRIRARRALHQVIERDFRPHEAAYLFLRHPTAGTLEMRAYSSASGVRRGNSYTSGGDAGPGLSLLTGLVPDPVATVTALFPKQPFRPPGYPPFSYPTELSVTVPVVGNTVTFEVPRDSRDAFPDRQVWRDASGRVVRVVTDG